MRRKLIDLMNRRGDLLTDAENALKAGNTEAYNTAMNEVSKLNDEIADINVLLAEQGRFADNDTARMALHDSLTAERADRLALNALDAARSGNEYVNAFVNALRNGISPRMAASDETYAPLVNAMTTTSTGDSGGSFIVPLDFDNMIHDRMKTEVDISNLFTVEPVTGMTGWRASATGTPAAMAEVDEMVAIEEATAPTLGKVTYKIRKFADFVPVSAELLNGESVNLLNFLANWYAPRYVATKNKLLLDALKKAVPSPTSCTYLTAVSSIKTALNKTLHSSDAANAQLLMNSTAYNELDNLVDGDNRPLLRPLLTDPAVMMFGGKRVTKLDDSQLANSSKNAPIYIGNFAATATLFSHGALQMDTTNVGGDAWRKGSTEIRGMAWLDAQVFDKSASTGLLLTPSGT